MKRLLYNNLLEWKSSKNRKPLLLKGARQVGKSWLLREFGKSFKDCHYINFEISKLFFQAFEDTLDPVEIIRKISLITGKTINIEEDVLIIDEIQLFPRALTSLKYFCEEMPELAVCTAGSHIGVTFADDSFPVGKVNFMQLYPMNFCEYLFNFKPMLYEAFKNIIVGDLEHSLLWKEYLKYSFVGGMPEALKTFENDDLETINQIRYIQTDLLKSYASDFAKHSGKQNASHILSIYENIPKQLQASYDDSVSRFKFKGIIPNRSKYSQFKGPIDWLNHTALVHQCHNVTSPQAPLNAYEKENLFKLFYSDIGLLYAALGVEYLPVTSQDYGTYKGFVAENFVAQELKASGYDLRYWKKTDPSSSAEIEFIIQKNSKIIPIEVKSGIKSTKSKSLRSYKNKYKPDVSIKLSGRKLRLEKDQINAPVYFAGKLDTLIDQL